MTEGREGYFRAQTAPYNSQLAAEAALQAEPSVLGVDNTSMAFEATLKAGPSITHPPSRSDRAVGKPKAKPAEGRRIFLVRNAERLDRTFPEWMHVAFDGTSAYHPYDVNMPLRLFPRAGFPRSYCLDPPITEMGAMTAQMIGRGFKALNQPLRTILSSPALRCVQTAHNIVKEMKNEAQIGIDASLFDFPGWYEQQPEWMTNEELTTAGIAIDGNYVPILQREAVREYKTEPYVSYQNRVGQRLNTLLKGNKESPIMLVTHGATMDAIARSLMKKQPAMMNAQQRNVLGTEFPFCSVAVFEESKEGKWKAIDDALPSLTYVGFSNRPTMPFAGK